MQVGDRVVRVRNDRLIGIARTELLAVLQRHAEKAGVRLEYGARRRAGDLDADIVIAADGIGSATREAGDFGGNAEVGRGLYLWCGADFALTDAVFAPVETEHGTFVTHAYPYSDGRSTFLIETDEQTWRRAGFEASTGQTPPDASDLTSLRYLQEAFAGQLRGHSLIGNRTRWLRFRTVRCERWSCGRTVLLGDAAHTAHFSIGSGTKLAMEDAIGAGPGAGRGAGRGPRVRPVRGHPPPGRGAAAGTRPAQPAVVGVVPLAAARPGRAADGRLHDPGRQRAARPARDHQSRRRRERPGPVRGPEPEDPADPADPRGPHQLDPGPAAARARAGSSRTGSSRPTQTASALHTITDVVADPWGRAADAVVRRARRAREAGAGGFRFTGPADRPSVLTRMDLAERVRTEVGGLIVVDGPAGLRDDLAAGLVSARADLVSLTEEAA